jgi:Na+-driven multidrug efflux pump
MLALVVAVSSHILFNWLLLVKLSLGIKGAAFATGIGYCIAFGMAILPFFSKKAVLKLFAGSFDKRAALHILYSGSSGGLSEMGTGIATFLFNITLMRYVGEMGVVAFTVISYLAFIGSNVLIGLSDGVGAIISYNYGSRQMDRVKKALQLVSATAFVIGVGLFIAMFVFSKEVIALFLNDGHEEVLAFAVYGTKLYAFAFLVNGLNIVAAGYFTAIGSPKQAVLIALSKGIVWIAVGMVMLPALLGIQGIWLTVPIAEIVTVMLSGALLYRHFINQVERY